MDIQNDIKKMAERVITLKSNIQTEEATKNAFVMPFLQMLGYDIFNPIEVIPEFVADIGIKKGEKVDYAIMRDGIPIMIVECKCWKENLNVHDSQLCRYFHTVNAKFGLLTNGIKYRFYTDLVDKNKMDDEPFLEFDFENIKENLVNELVKFHKSTFDVNRIIDSASTLKYTTAIKSVLMQELSEPSEEFAKLLAKRVYPGNLTAKFMEQFTPIVKTATNQSLREIVSERLQAAIKKEEDNHTAIIEDPVIAETPAVITTDEEIEGFHIIKSILRENIDLSRVGIRDNQSYCGVLLDDNNRKPLCRMYFNTTKKYLALFDENKKEEKILLEQLDDIYKYADRLKEMIKVYEN